MLDLGEFRFKAKVLKPVYITTDYGEYKVGHYTVHADAFVRRRDIEWSTIGEEAHGKQLVTEARTEFYLKKYRSEITEDYVILQGRYTYEITRVDDFDYGRYTRLVCLRRDNFNIAEDSSEGAIAGQYVQYEVGTY